jgi:hypothetical protein
LCIPDRRLKNHGGFSVLWIFHPIHRGPEQLDLGPVLGVDKIVAAGVKGIL